MPPKKKNACPSVYPELYAKSMKPSMTMAMGFKLSQGASHCWRAQVEAEQRIHDRWSALYNPGEEEAHDKALQHTLQRESERHQTYRANNAALQDVLCATDAAAHRLATAQYLHARNAVDPQGKYSKPQTASQEIGWTIAQDMRDEKHFASWQRTAQKEALRKAALAYKRPDDEDMALLMGYSLQRSYE